MKVTIFTPKISKSQKVTIFAPKSWIFQFLSWFTLQSLSRPPWWSSHGETETEAYPNDIHLRPTQRIGKGVSGDPLSRHLHAWGDCHEDRLDRSTCTGNPFVLFDKMVSDLWSSLIDTSSMMCSQCLKITSKSLIF